MLSSYLVRVLTTVSAIPLVLIASAATAQSPAAGEFEPLDVMPVQVADADLIEVGVTDVVEQRAIGTVATQIRSLQISDTIFFNETVETGPDSATRVTFQDDSSLTLGPSSQVVIDRFIYDPASNTGELALSLTEGVFRFASGTLDSENYAIDTPVGTIGIRGTVIEVAVGCIELAAGDCEVTLDVISGRTSFDGADEEAITPRGSRMHYRPAVSRAAQVTALPPGAAPLPGLEDMGQRINQSVVDLINGVLPSGVTFATATPAQLARAAVQLASQNPRLGDLLVEVVALSREDALGMVSSTLMAEVPASTPRVVAALSNVLGSTPNNGRGPNDSASPFGDDDLRDDDDPDEQVASSPSPDDGGDGGGSDGGDNGGGDDGGSGGGDDGGDDGGGNDGGGDDGGSGGGDDGGDDGGSGGGDDGGGPPDSDAPGNSGTNGNDVSGSPGNQASDRGDSQRDDNGNGGGDQGNAGGTR